LLEDGGYEEFPDGGKRVSFFSDRCDEIRNYRRGYPIPRKPARLKTTRLMNLMTIKPEN
jgi:hypothetical protein